MIDSRDLDEIKAVDNDISSAQLPLKDEVIFHALDQPPTTSVATNVFTDDTCDKNLNEELNEMDVLDNIDLIMFQKNMIDNNILDDFDAHKAFIGSNGEGDTIDNYLVYDTISLMNDRSATTVAQNTPTLKVTNAAERLIDPCIHHQKFDEVFDIELHLRSDHPTDVGEASIQQSSSDETTTSILLTFPSNRVLQKKFFQDCLVAIQNNTILELQIKSNITNGDDVDNDNIVPSSAVYTIFGTATEEAALSEQHHICRDVAPQNHCIKENSPKCRSKLTEKTVLVEQFTDSHSQRSQDGEYDRMIISPSDDSVAKPLIIKTRTKKKIAKKRHRQLSHSSRYSTLKKTKSNTNRKCQCKQFSNLDTDSAKAIMTCNQLSDSTKFDIDNCYTKVCLDCDTIVTPSMTHCTKCNSKRETIPFQKDLTYSPVATVVTNRTINSHCKNDCSSSSRVMDISDPYCLDCYYSNLRTEMSKIRKLHQQPATIIMEQVKQYPACTICNNKNTISSKNETWNVTKCILCYMNNPQIKEGMMMVKENTDLRPSPRRNNT